MVLVSRDNAGGRLLPKEFDAEAHMRATRDTLGKLNRCAQRIKDVQAKQSQLDRLVRTREISERVAEALKKEDEKTLVGLTEEFFSFLGGLDDLRARTRIELERARVELERIRSAAKAPGEAPAVGRDQRRVSEMTDLLRGIDEAQRSLDMEMELFIVRHYLTSFGEAGEKEMALEEQGKRRRVCREFLNGVLKDWNARKGDIMKQVSDFDSSISDLRGLLRETWIRYAVGELDQKAYNRRREELEGKLSEIEKQSTSLRAHVEEVDTKVSACLDLLKET